MIVVVYGFMNIVVWFDDKVVNMILVVIIMFFDFNFVVFLFVVICFGYWCLRDFDFLNLGILGFVIMVLIVFVVGVVDWFFGGWIV